MAAAALESKVHSILNSHPDAYIRSPSNKCSKGIPAEVILLNDIIEQAYHDPEYGPEKAYEELGTHFFDAIAQCIGQRILECGERVPIVTGIEDTHLYKRHR